MLPERAPNGITPEAADDPKQRSDDAVTVSAPEKPRVPEDTQMQGKPIFYPIWMDPNNVGWIG